MLAAASARVLARSFHSTLNVGFEVLAQVVGSARVTSQTAGALPVIAWKRRELSVLLEHVQAHIAPTDVDLRAGLQWLPKIPTGAPKLKRTGALLERVFIPCTIHLQYTRHKGGTSDGKVQFFLHLLHIHQFFFWIVVCSHTQLVPPQWGAISIQQFME